MKQSPFRAWISYWLFVCMLCVLTSLGCHSVHLVRAVAQHGQPYIPVATEERLKECAALVEKNIEPRLYSVLDAGGSIDQKADGTTTFTRSDGVAVTYDKAGYPDFTPYRHPTVKDVQIEFTGSYPKDNGLADKAAGISEAMRDSQEYTWHHHQDAKTMQLIKKDVHREFFHTGGMSGARAK